jgi:hypothetical protein
VTAITRFLLGSDADHKIREFGRSPGRYSRLAARGRFPTSAPGQNRRRPSIIEQFSIPNSGPFWEPETPV